MKTLLPQRFYHPYVFLILVMIAGFLAFEAVGLALPIVNAHRQMNTGSCQKGYRICNGPPFKRGH